MQTGKFPEPRWKHTALCLEDNRILIFGGFKSTSQRYESSALSTEDMHGLLLTPNGHACCSAPQVQ
jgi:hypothetical protein